MTMNLLEQDKHHRLLALDASKSFIVQAPAGSGKTELLIQRFLTLLAIVNAPEEILAITFTKKAASEMRLRVIKALKQALTEAQPVSPHGQQTWLLAKKVLQRDQQLQWNLIDNPNQLRIQTIDSLCSHFTRQLPLLSHFGSQPDIADQPAMLYSAAVQEVLMHVEENYEWSQSIAELLLHLDNDLNKLHDLLVSLLSKRDQWLPYIQLNSSDNEIKHQLEIQLSHVIADSLQRVERIFPKLLTAEILEIARFAAAHVAADSDIRACESLTVLPSTDAKNQRAYLGLATLLLTKSFSFRKRLDADIGFPALKTLKNPQEIALHTEYRQRLTQLLVTLSEHENLRVALAELFYLPKPFYTDNQWKILQSLLHVLKIAAAQLRVTFQQSGQIDFIENTQGALSALGNDEHPTDLVLALDYHIQHILIDEFQDTSHTQYQLLEKLTQGWEKNDGRTLFVVGDPMQSIYRFREAEVGLFIRMRSKGIHHIELIPLTLAVNFRSDANIVEWNNASFTKLFPPFNDMATGAVSYSPSVAQTAINKMLSNKSITISGFVNASKEVEAQHIIDLITATQSQFPSENIAVLVRSRPHLAAIIPALKKEKIAYRALDIDPLESRQVIQDLLSLTCALLHPADRISWLAVLRAPWCGLTLADLFVIAGSDTNAAILMQLESTEIIQKLSDDGRKRLAKILPVLRQKMAVRERYHLRVWVESTWLLLGGPACLHDYTDIEDVNAYFELLDEFSDKHQILNLDKLKERMSKLYAYTQHENANVHIMTIHTAKGLEFDTVILPQLERKNPMDDKALLSWMEQPLMNEQMALLLAPIHATGDDKDAMYEYIQRQQRVKSTYETDRLFYVATTRAKHRLHLSFTVTRNEDNAYRIEPGSFLAKIWPQFENRHQDILTENKVELDNSELNVKRHIHRMQASWSNPVREFARQQMNLHKQPGGFQQQDNTPRLIGIAVHRVLQMLARNGIPWWKMRNAQEINAYLTSMLQQLGVSKDKLEFALTQVLLAINNTLNDERGRWILDKHAHAQSEFALTAVLDGHVESLIIDRIFVDAENTLWIVDYKTATLDGAEVNDFLNKEQKKYAEQMQKYQQALRLQHTGEIRLGLYFPALPAWCEL